MKYGRLEVEAWEAAAMIEGHMTQKRVAGPAYFWKIGQLRWVQEPFTEYTGVRKELAYGIVYHADHNGASLEGYPTHLKNVHCRLLVREAAKMLRQSSRLTIEITSVQSGDRYKWFSTDDWRAEGYDVMHRWGADVRSDCFRRGTPPGQDVVLIGFKAITAPLGKVLAAREAAA